MGCKLLEIMADGLHAVFHRFEAFLKKGWRTSSDYWISIQRPSCFFNLCSSCSSRSNKRRRDCLLPPPRGRLCYHAGLTARPYSHRWPSHPFTHPHLLLFSAECRPTPHPNQSSFPLLSVCDSTAASSPSPGRSLPRPRHRPPPWCARRGVVNVVNDTSPTYL